MNRAKYKPEQLVKLFQKKKVLTMSEMKMTLGTNSTMTIFRLLKKNRIILSLCALLMGNIFNTFAQDAGDFVYMTEDYKPWSYLEDGKLIGISVEVLQQIWIEMGQPEQEIQVLPWRRGYNYVQTKKNHVLFAMVRTDERESLFKWVGPISTTRSLLVGLSKNKIQINSLEDAKKYSIGTMRGAAPERFLKIAGFNKIQAVGKIDQNVNKLHSGRVDLIACNERGFLNLMKTISYDQQEFETVWVLEEEHDYYAFHKDTPDSVINKFQQALDSIDSKRQDILNKYLSQ